MLLRLDGVVKVIDFKLDVSWNALSPMLVTLGGMVIDSKPDKENAPFPMLLTVSLEEKI